MSKYLKLFCFWLSFASAALVIKLKCLLCSRRSRIAFRLFLLVNSRNDSIDCTLDVDEPSSLLLLYDESKSKRGAAGDVFCLFKLKVWDELRASDVSSSFCLFDSDTLAFSSLFFIMLVKSSKELSSKYVNLLLGFRLACLQMPSLNEIFLFLRKFATVLSFSRTSKKN